MIRMPILSNLIYKLMRSQLKLQKAISWLWTNQFQTFDEATDHNSKYSAEEEEQVQRTNTGLKPFTNINSKQTTHVNVKFKIVKLLEDNMKENIGDLGFGNEIFKYKTKNTIHERKIKFYFIKIKKLLGGRPL